MWNHMCRNMCINLENNSVHKSNDCVVRFTIRVLHFFYIYIFLIRLYHTSFLFRRIKPINYIRKSLPLVVVVVVAPAFQSFGHIHKLVITNWISKKVLPDFTRSARRVRDGTEWCTRRDVLEDVGKSSWSRRIFRVTMAASKQSLRLLVKPPTYSKMLFPYFIRIWFRVFISIWEWEDSFWDVSYH